MWMASAGIKSMHLTPFISLFIKWQLNMRRASPSATAVLSAQEAHGWPPINAFLPRILVFCLGLGQGEISRSLSFPADKLGSGLAQQAKNLGK